MKALSLKLMDGYIDQVDEIVSISWIQGRYLQKEQIQKVLEKMQDWRSNVCGMESVMRAEGHELFEKV